MITPKKMLVYRIRAEMLIAQIHKERETIIQKEKGGKAQQPPAAPTQGMVSPNG